MKATILEGTADEIIQAINAIERQSETALTISHGESLDPDPPSQPVESARDAVTTEFARRALRRRPLSKALRAVLKALYDANSDYVTTTSLLGVAGYGSGHQFAGLMGAFGRRLANTPGYDPEARFFDWQWNDDEGAWEYRLFDTVREALEQERLV